MLFAGILNPGDAYGTVTEVVALDCEYDADMDTNLKMPCKVTIVNAQGHIILDTLISQLNADGTRKSLRREVGIHGICSEVLEGAPTLEEVKAHIFSLLPREKTMMVGHSIKNDLLVLEFTNYYFFDTSIFLDKKQPRSLKDCLADYLNAEVQAESGTHSSVIDARSTLALLHYFNEQVHLGKHLIDGQPLPESMSSINFILEQRGELFTERDLEISL